MLKKLCKYISVCLFACLAPGLVYGQANTFEVGTGTIASTFGFNPSFTTFDFAVPFVDAPLVFVLPSTSGADECDVRIENVTLTSFDAACVEAPPRDGAHVGMFIRYLATTPGLHSIPTTGGGTVDFEAGFIDTQTVQHNCASGCGAEGWDLVTPSSVSPSNAAIISQIQTTANETGNVPGDASEPFLTTAMDINQGGANQFGLAIERNEVNNGSITADERIGWLVVEDTGGCETLDFSSFGGPAAVAFQSIVTDDLDDNQGGDIHDAVDGWNNGCNVDEGATFAAGCFTNTPVVVANKRTRNSGDGGWLRTCFVNGNEIRLTIDEDRDRDGERNHPGEGVSVVAFGESFTTPVTLSQISIQQTNRKVDFSWETSTETFNIGFNLWGNIEGKWEQLNKRLIPSSRADKLAPQSYQARVKLSSTQADKVEQFGLSSLDITGKDEFFGPFLAGESYGEQAIPEAIDWQAIKAESNKRMQARGYTLHNNRWRKNHSVTDDTVDQRIDISITEPGLYRVTYEDLLAMGVDWNNVRSRTIALSHQAKAVARRVLGQGGKFGPGSSIEFYVTAPRMEDALYTATNVYQLQIDRSLVQAMPFVDHSVEDDELTSDHGFDGSTVGENLFYTELSTSDPWMDHELFSFGSAVSKSYTVSLPADVDHELGGRFGIRLIGGIDFPGQNQPDHHLQVYINDQLVADEFSDGFDPWNLDLPIAAGVLQQGNNIVRVELPGDTGFTADIVNIDTLKVSGLKKLVWSSDSGESLTFEATENATSYRVELPQASSRPTVYITQAGGNVARVRGLAIELDEETALSTILLPILAMQDRLEDVAYWLGSPEQMRTPAMNVVETPDVMPASGDYLIIAHPNFMGTELDDFAHGKSADGLSVQIINWLDVVQSYGYGMPTPKALQRFLIAAERAIDYEYVLLVGGHSYDYLDHLNLGSISFIPTWYRPIKSVQLAPTDTPYVELDGDGLPDKAIGRWPVRSGEDLSAIIQKTNDWQNNGMASAQSALFIADSTEANRDYDLILENSMTQVSKRWEDIDTVYLDEVLGGTGSIADARQSIIDSVNDGASLTVFNGHGSPSAWTFQGLMSWQHLQSLENTGVPTLVLPLACWTTYYETPSVNSLAHQWLFNNTPSGDTAGAVAIHGAMVLSDYTENTLFADQVLTQQLAKGKTLGQAILKAKRRLAPWQDMVNNWALLGDPSLKLEP